MTSSKKKSVSQSVDKWLEALFLDPLTTFLDETAFRIDIFESGTHFIIEADIPAQSTETSVALQENTVIISLNCCGEIRSRTVDWPFDVREHEVVAYKVDQVLEILIDKEKMLAPVDRLIEIKK